MTTISVPGSVSTTEQGFGVFDELPPAPPESIRGRAGHELPTGHLLDGKLTAAGWYGKEFLDSESVHPPIFADQRGRAFPVDPRR